MRLKLSLFRPSPIAHVHSPSIGEIQSVARLDSNNLRLRVALPTANPLNRPCSVLCDQWLRIGCCAFERWKVAWIAYIAERDTHIA